MRRVVPDEWMPECAPERIIAHWSAGAYHATDHDRDCYHYLVEGDGRLVRGHWTPRDNSFTGDGNYAAHTGGFNTKSIGVAVCCMGDAVEAPFSAGRWPMKKVQWETLVLVIADLAERYQIPVVPQAVCGHGMVYAHHGRKNPTGKWDPLKLPWIPTATKTDVDRMLREQVIDAIHAEQVSFEPIRPVNVVVDGKEISGDGYMAGDKAWVPIRPVAEALGLVLVDLAKKEILVTSRDQHASLSFENRGGIGYVPARELREKLGLTTGWNPATRTVSLGV